MIPKKTILFVDDELWFKDSLIEDLEEAGYEVRTAANETTAIDILVNESVDLVILDIMMPPERGGQIAYIDGGRTTGIRIAQFIREEMNSKIPIIFYTVVADQAVRARIELIEKMAGLESRILVKPAYLQDLIDEVRDSLNKV